jgi:hypothetical protein
VPKRPIFEVLDATLARMGDVMIRNLRNDGEGRAM